MLERDQIRIELPELVADIKRRPRKIITRSAGETEELGWVFARIKDLKFLAMRGDLGTGKTTFIRGLARGLRIKSKVKSPTFVLRHDYEGPRPLKHLDFFRLESARELEALGWPFEGEENIWAVEWADRFPELMPSHSLWISFEILDESRREIHIGMGPG